MSVDKLRRRAKKHGLVLRHTTLSLAEANRWRVQSPDDSSHLCKCSNDWRCDCLDHYPNPEYRGTEPLTYREIENYLESLSGT